MGVGGGAKRGVGRSRSEARTSRREAVHEERLGAALRSRWSQVGEAVAAGRVTWEQAGVLARALEALPVDLDRARDARWHTARLPNGDVRYTRRT